MTGALRVVSMALRRIRPAVPRDVLAAALLSLACAACGGGGGSDGAPVAGNPAPAFSARTLDGGELALRDLRGEVVVLNVWATWCGPCVREMPALEAVHREFADEGVRVVGVSIDRGAAEAEVRRFVEDHDITFTILLDPDQQVSTLYRLLGVPATILIDRDGVIARRFPGELAADAADLREALRALLAS